MPIVIILVAIAVVIAVVALISAVKWLLFIALVVVILGGVRAALTRGKSR